MISGVAYKKNHPIYCFFCQKMGTVQKAYAYFYLHEVPKGICLTCLRDKTKVSNPEKEQFYEIEYTNAYDEIIDNCKDLPVDVAVKFTDKKGIIKSWSSMKYAVEKISAGMGCPLIVKLKKTKADGEYAVIWRETTEDRDWRSPSYTPLKKNRRKRKGN